jgi:hypothetical protein
MNLKMKTSGVRIMVRKFRFIITHVLGNALVISEYDGGPAESTVRAESSGIHKAFPLFGGAPVASEA